MVKLLGLRNEKKASWLASVYSLLPMAGYVLAWWFTHANLKQQPVWLLYALGVALVSSLPLIYLWYRAYWIEKYGYKIWYNDNVLVVDLVVVVAFLIFVILSSGAHFVMA